MMLKTAAGRLDSGDIDKYRQLVQPWELSIRQMSPGRFRARIDYVQVNGKLIYREHYRVVPLAVRIPNPLADALSGLHSSEI